MTHSCTTVDITSPVTSIERDRIGGYIVHLDATAALDTS